MKKFLALTVYLLLMLQLMAQFPGTFSYQAVVRDAGGNLIINHNVSFRVSIHTGSAGGAVVYSETHHTTTNPFGLATLTIGGGTPVSGSFSSVEWGKDPKYLEIEIDPDGGNSFITMGTSPVLNVPLSRFSGCTAGILNMTTLERDAITSPGMGMQIFNTDTRKINYYDGYGWLEVIGVRQADFSCGNPVLDPRDGSYYNTVEITGMCWMAQNLNVGTMIQGGDSQADNGTIEKYCYSNNPTLCQTYGGLYQWREMMQYSTTAGIQGICMDGWHLPADTEWTTLINATGGPGGAGANLVQGGSSGFEALMGGQRNLNTGYPFINIGTRAYFWTSTQVSTSTAYDRYIQSGNPQVYTEQLDKYYGLSVRCVKD